MESTCFNTSQILHQNSSNFVYDTSYEPNDAENGLDYYGYEHHNASATYADISAQHSSSAEMIDAQNGHNFMWETPHQSSLSLSNDSIHSNSSVCGKLSLFVSFPKYRTRANRPPTVYFLFRFLAVDLSKRVICSRGWSI